MEFYTMEVYTNMKLIKRGVSLLLVIATAFALVVSATASHGGHRNDQIPIATTATTTPSHIYTIADLGDGWEQVKSTSLDYYGKEPFAKSGLPEAYRDVYGQLRTAICNVVGNLESGSISEGCAIHDMWINGVSLPGIQETRTGDKGSYRIHVVQSGDFAARKIEGCYLNEAGDGFVWKVIPSHTVGAPEGICHPYLKLSDGSRQWYEATDKKSYERTNFFSQPDPEKWSFIGHVTNDKAEYTFFNNASVVKVRNPRTGELQCGVSFLISGKYNPSEHQVDFQSCSGYAKIVANKTPFYYGKIEYKIGDNRATTVNLTKIGEMKKI